MYGETELTPINSLKYAYTKEFFEQFSSLKYEGIEIPIVLMRYFHNFIRPIVQDNFHNEHLVKQMQEKHQLFTIKDVQRTLVRFPEKKESTIKSNQKKAIMMTAMFLDFALEQLTDYPVLIVVINERDRELVRSRKLPSNFTVCDFYRESKKVRINANILKELYKRKNQLLIENRKHPFFGRQDFQNWFIDRRIYLAMQMIQYLKDLIINKNVGLMIDHVEVINPSILFGLFSRQLNIPFILSPQLLMTDRSLIPTRATHYLVWGKYYREWLEKRDIPPANITEIGSIRFHYQMKNEFIKITRRRFHLVTKVPEDHFVVTFMTQPFPLDDNFKYWLLQWIVDSIGSLPLTVIIRTHPADKFDYKSYIQNHKNIIIVPNERMSLYQLIDHSDAIMTVSSNTAIEATMLKKAIIVLQPRFPDKFEFHENNIHSYLARGDAGVVAYNKYDLKLHLEKFVKDEQFRENLVIQGQNFLQNTINQNVSPPERLKAFIERLLKN